MGKTYMTARWVMSNFLYRKQRAVVRVALLISTAGLLSQLQGEKQSPYEHVTVPAYHDAAPQEALPPIMSPDAVSDTLNKNAYAIASKVSPILYQQPCYCYCDRANGHKSLRDCYTSKHATTCTVCQRELFYVYEQSQKQKNATQIRKGIMAADWADVDLSKYENPLK
jgi:hypothetical protein